MTLLSIVVPVYNERDTVAAVVERIEAVGLPAGVEREILLVDDGSTDGSGAILEGLARAPGRTLLAHGRNRGKGAAVRTGLAASRGDIVLVQDADLEYDPAEYPKLLAPILSGRADVVYGSRFVVGESHRVPYFRHYVGNRLLTTLSNLFTNVNLTDMETCFKVFRGEVARSLRLEEERFGFEPEVTAKVARMGCRIHEVGVSYSGRTYAEGKKVTWRDGVRALWCILKYR